MSTVTLINPFQIKDNQIDDCLLYWKQAAAYMLKQPGFISTDLMQILQNGGKFPLINIAQWSSIESFQNAISSDGFREITKTDAQTFPHSPALYRKAISFA
jgi:heme-degrading monooxygenase HmoA